MPATKKYKPCKHNQVRHPSTNRCRQVPAKELAEKYRKQNVRLFRSVIRLSAKLKWCRLKSKGGNKAQKKRSQKKQREVMKVSQQVEKSLPKLQFSTHFDDFVNKIAKQHGVTDEDFDRLNEEIFGKK